MANNYSDKFTYTPEDLDKARGCLKQLNDYMHTPGYGQLSKDTTKFINKNKTWYKGSSSRGALSSYEEYYGMNGDGSWGRQQDLVASADNALNLMNRTIKGLAQIDQDVQTYFDEGVPEKELVKWWELLFDSAIDGAAIDSYNGIIAWINAGRLAAGKIPLPYADRLSASDTLGEGNEALEAFVGTLGYATGSAVTEFGLTCIPYVGKYLAKAHAMTQGVGVGVAHAMSDDGMVSVGETVSSLLVGTALGFGFDFTGKQVTKVVGDLFAKAGLEIVGKTIGSFANGSAGAYLEEVISELVIGATGLE